jgi:BirA family transcriptional regulator, biotin operon repressor / biotin---[acetyl-CoA-carboxylase] ligase
MKIIKLSAIPSTNLFLKNLATDSSTQDFTVVVAESQTDGLGQRGNKWVVEEGKNLIFSVLVKDSHLYFKTIFDLNVYVSVCVISVLKRFFNLKFHCKWPNDILAENKKIAGILIENTLKAGDKRDSIIGIGLNVNQIQFENLPAASSLSLLLKQNIDKEQLLTGLLSELENQLPLFLQSKTTFWQKYHSFLFKINTPMAFKNDERGTFMGIIKGVSQLGMLEVELEDEKTIEFAFKEVQMLY